MTDKQIATAPRHYQFTDDGWSKGLQGRFWNCQGKQIAIVASVTKIDWAAYIGTDAPDSYTEKATCLWALKHGCKLSVKDAKHYFPDIKLPYRG